MFSILVDRITMAEKDEDVAAEWLANEIAHFQLTLESARAAIARANESLECR